MTALNLQVRESTSGAGSSAPSPGASHPRATREVRHEYTPNLPSILQGLNASLLVSTYQAGKVVGVSLVGGELALSYHNFERAMGVAVRSRVVAVGARAQVWFLESAPDVARRIEPPGRHDACYVTRSSRFTGEIQGHEMAWSGEDLWVVNTAFSCLCTLHPEHSFEPRWRPPFVSTLAPEDRCHLNGLAMMDGRPKYVTVLGETDQPQGWRPGKAAGGALIDIDSSATVARGFAMPHSPRVHGGQVWLLHSGVGRLVRIDPGEQAFMTTWPRCQAMPADWRSPGRSPSSGCRRFARLPRSAACQSPNGVGSSNAVSAWSTCEPADLLPTSSSLRVSMRSSTFKSCQVSGHHSFPALTRLSTAVSRSGPFRARDSSRKP